MAPEFFCYSTINRKQIPLRAVNTYKPFYQRFIITSLTIHLRLNKEFLFLVCSPRPEEYNLISEPKIQGKKSFPLLAEKEDEFSSTNLQSTPDTRLVNPKWPFIGCRITLIKCEGKLPIPHQTQKPAPWLMAFSLFFHPGGPESAALASLGSLLKYAISCLPPDSGLNKIPGVSDAH